MAGARGGTHTTAGGDRITGGVGTPPPPGAPIENTQPLSSSAIAEAAARAKANEKELPAFNPKVDAADPRIAKARADDLAIARGRGGKRPPVVTGPQTLTTPVNSIIITDAGVPPALVSAIVDATGNALLVEQDMQDAREAVHAIGDAAAAAGDAAQADILGPRTNAPIADIGIETPPAIASAPAADLGVQPAPAAEPPPLSPNLAPPTVAGKLATAARDLLAHRARSTQPAASNTDSPARGIPTEATDPGKRITGGFGDAIDQQYFPLDGGELREVVKAIMRYLADQLENDLRFSVALCYPRVRAQVTISIQGYTSEMDFALTRGHVHDRTPVEIAEAHGDQPVEFTLDGTIEEMSNDGESVMPPNAMRESLGLAVPRKERIQMPTGGFSVVDRRA